ncbi:hypothetical protein L596_012377 [Steinernema carpocapsae]|uniref:G-protein coupled receptors family 1 profile domain-containing protein n=1 Tax=Steinernema carpocapsae TaxID=34508 RepID=A0A4U5NXP5_STECR|nr:hypothetical protein L596_012377 [Steinernema carpocapsae]
MAENGTVFDLEQFCNTNHSPYFETRFWVVAVFGSLISSLSIALNLTFFGLVWPTRVKLESAWFYLLLLALFDSIYSLFYLLDKPMNFLASYGHIVFLKSLIAQIYVAQNYARLSALFMIVFLVFCLVLERFCVSKSYKLAAHLQNRQKSIAFVGFVLAIFSHVSVFYDFMISRNSGCAGTLNEYSKLMTHFWKDYGQFIQHYRSAVYILTPFLSLFVLIGSLRTTSRLNSYNPVLQSGEATGRNVKLRVLIFVVIGALGWPILQIVDILRRRHFDVSLHIADMYPVSVYLIVDAMHLIPVVVSAFRPPFYLIFEPSLRAELKSENSEKQFLKN